MSLVVPSVSRSSKQEIEETLDLCYGRTGVFGKTFMPEAFSTEFSPLHKQMIDKIDGPSQYVAIAAPRGLGKTTTVKAKIISDIEFRDEEFILYISKSEKHAMMQTENIKRELLMNRELHRVFGSVKVSDYEGEMEEEFSKGSWVAFGRTLVMPRGNGQQVRGLLYGNKRPGLIIIDDLEDKDEVQNPENRRKLKDWFWSDVMKCINRYDKQYRFIYIDTLKHEDSLLQNLLSDPSWDSVRLDLCDDEYNSNVPELFTTEELKAEAQRHRDQGMLDVFFMEYRNLPISKENMSFNPNHFRYFDPQELDWKSLETVVIVDPAKTAQIQSADSAIVGIAIDYKTNAIYFLDCVSNKMYPDQIYEEMFAMRRRLKAMVVGVEVTGLEEFIKQPIMNEMLKRGPEDMFEPVWLKARGGAPDGEKGKIARIKSLVPYYRLGYIYHNKLVCAKLESQLISFPRSALLDVADALAYVIELLEIGGRYFTTPDPPPDEDGNDRNWDPEDEFADLDYEEPVRNWRVA